MNDSIAAASGTQYSGVSVSHDGGATFTRLSPSPFATGHTDNFGDPIIVYNQNLGEWVAGDLASGCGGQGIGLWTSTNGDTWSPGVCAVSESLSPGGADRESMWVDNNASSAFYGRMYISWNDFNLANAAIKVTHSDDGTTWSTPVTLNPIGGFRRQVEITGSPGSDGTVFAGGIDEGGGGCCTATEQNYMFKSTDGGVTFTSSATAAIPATFTIPGESLCPGSSYFPRIAPIWRQTGYGIPAVGPNGVVQYVYAAHGAGSDPADVFYVRSTDNGATWSTPVKLNTDATTEPQWMPSLSVTPSGIVEATWYDRRNTTDGTNYQRFVRFSNDNGATWGPDQPLSSGLIPQPNQPDPNVQACYAGDYNYTAATATTGFDTWTDGRVSIALNGPQQDVFLHASHVPTLTVSTAGSGSVISGDNTITCPGSCAHSYADGTQETLTANAASGSHFVGWSGGGCSGTASCVVTLSADQGVVATFASNTPASLRTPVLSGLGVSPKKFSLAGRKVKGKCVKPTKQNNGNKHCKRPIKLKISYSLNTAAGVTFTLKRKVPGRKVRGKCVKQTQKNKNKKKCTLVKKVKGSITRSSTAGANTFTFNGKIGGHKLGPGTYQLIAIPAGGKPQQVTFKITK
jgi:hypothetical protein